MKVTELTFTMISDGKEYTGHKKLPDTLRTPESLLLSVEALTHDVLREAALDSLNED